MTMLAFWVDAAPKERMRLPARVCGEPACGTVISIYNEGALCYACDRKAAAWRLGMMLELALRRRRAA